MWAGVGGICPGSGGFHGVFGGLLSKAAISPFVRLGGLDRLELVEEITFEGPNVAVVRAWVECREVPDGVRGHGERSFVCWRRDGREVGGCHGDGGGGRDGSSRRDGGCHGVVACRGLTAKELSSSIEQK